jgi:nucleoside-diphosphate-sugar epimerase
MPECRRVLITGHQGYIGSVMAPFLMSQGYDVLGFDTAYFGECRLYPNAVKVPAIYKDIRDVTPGDLLGFDAVIHLAALSNDPIGNLNPSWTQHINVDATVRLANCAKVAGVRRFIFSSSCIMYGMSDAALANEESPVAPQTEYARSKVVAEEALRELAEDNFAPTFCRNGTVYGLSPAMRFDTVLNNFVGSAFTTGRVVVHSDGTPWRPIVHVQDVARAFQAVLEAPASKVHNQAFNVGAAPLNCQIGSLGQIVAETVPGCEVEMLSQPGADQRTYQTDFSKFRATFPDFVFRWTAERGAAELYNAFRSLGLTRENFIDKRFTRLSWLRHLLDRGSLDAELRWKDAAVRVA